MLAALNTGLSARYYPKSVTASGSARTQIGRAVMPGRVPVTLRGVVLQVAVWNVARDIDLVGTAPRADQQGLVAH